jgi:phage shock protein E
MNWSYVVVAIAILIAFYAVKLAGQISHKSAQKYLKGGAMLIDVRDPDEFATRHLPKAINIPVKEIETELPRRVKDKDHVILLHCQSGMRAGYAKKTLRKMGYSNSYNIGSFERAFKIISGK